MRISGRVVASAALLAGVFGLAVPGAAHAYPGNDAFWQATPVSALPFSTTDTSRGATTDTGDPTPSCEPSSQATVWFRLSLGESTRVDLSTFGSKFDTVVAVYQGADAGHLTEVACNDDDVSTGSQQSRLSFAAGAGGTYFIQLGGYEGASGRYTLALVADPRPLNDDVASANTISLPFVGTDDLTRATVESGEPEGCAGEWPINFAHTTWYSLRPVGDLSVTVTAGGETAVVAYEGTPTNQSAVTCRRWSSASFTARAGHVYLIQLGLPRGYPTGPFSIHIDGVPPPTNDNIAGATDLTLSQTVRELTIGASTETDEPLCSDNFDWEYATVWYRYVAGADAPLLATTSGSDYDTVVAVYDGTSFDDLVRLGCNDNAGSTSMQGMTGFSAVQGHTYMIQVGTPWAYYPSGNLALRLEPGASIEDHFYGPAQVAAGHDAEATDAAAGNWIAGAGASVSEGQDGDSETSACVRVVLVTTSCLNSIPTPDP